jgi:hypothetical protein
LEKGSVNPRGHGDYRDSLLPPGHAGLRPCGFRLAARARSSSRLHDPVRARVSAFASGAGRRRAIRSRTVSRLRPALSIRSTSATLLREPVLQIWGVVPCEKSRFFALLRRWRMTTSKKQESEQPGRAAKAGGGLWSGWPGSRARRRLSQPFRRASACRARSGRRWRWGRRRAFRGAGS